MRKKYLNIIMCTSLLTLAGCSKEESIDPFYNEQHPIELGVGVESPMTRSVVTDGEGKTLEAFTDPTDIWMVMQSDYVSLGTANTDLDFKGGTGTKYCVTMGTTGDKTADGKANEVGFEISNLRYWDDIHSRSSRLSIWALAVPNKKSTALWSASNWLDTPVPTTEKAWTISATQTSTTIANEDLCFSNNIADYSPSGSDSRMKFNVNTSGNAFDKGQLIFYHALTKITINLVEGEGFDKTITTDFNIDTDAPVTLKGSSLSGTFDVKEGEFKTSTLGTATSIKMACGTKTQEATAEAGKTTSKFTLEALVMPGRDLSTTLADAVTFGIDKNKFTVSNETLLKALKENSAVASTWTTMEAGKNYVFTFTIKMTDIKVTATVAPWENVAAEEHAPKINIDKVYGHLDTEDECTDLQKGFDFYRSLEKAGDYTFGSKVTYAETPATGKRNYEFETPLYWPNHETHYFFRSVYPAGTTVSDSKISVSNGAYNSETSPSNLMLGYPRNTNGTPDEACKVHSGTQGICATEGDIRMNFQYAMSQVEVKLTTSDGDDKVVLDANTTIEILNGYKSGSIKLEDGSSVFEESDKGTYQLLGIENTYDRLDAIIPQPLTGLKFKITVKDSDGKYDSYEAAIANIEVTPTGGTKGIITEWKPGKKYIYTLKITKTGIKITATLKDWETVTSGENHIWM